MADTLEILPQSAYNTMLSTESPCGRFLLQSSIIYHLKAKPPHRAFKRKIRAFKNKELRIYGKIRKKQSVRFDNATISGMTQKQKELLKVFASRAGTKDNPKGRV